MKILWVVPKWTFPINDGARIATDRLLRAVAKAGAEIEVLSLCNKHEVVDVELMRQHWPVSAVHVLRRGLPQGLAGKWLYYTWKSITQPHMPLTFSSFAAGPLEESVRELMEKTHYDLVLLDGLHTAVAFEGIIRGLSSRARFILRAHNVEADLWVKASEQAQFYPKRWFLKLQAHKVKKFESEILNLVDGIAAIAKEDLAHFSQLTSKPLAYVPLGLNFSEAPDHLGVEPDHFLFVGRLDWPPNRDGLRWLLENVWPKVKIKRPQAVLTIAGVGDSSWLKTLAQLPGVRFLGRVESVKAVYQRAAFAIAPLFYGSGTRIKIIEAFAMNRSLISTSMGVQGAEVTDNMYYNAENVDQWVELMSTVSYGPESMALLASARRQMSEKFDEQQVGKAAYDWFKTL